MNGRFAWSALLFALVVATVAGMMSYNAGVSHGLAVAHATAGMPAAPTVPYAYYYRPWGWGPGFAPLFFLLVWVMMFGMFRGLFWGGWRRRGVYGPGGRHDAFDEWHRRAHEEMNKKS